MRRALFELEVGDRAIRDVQDLSSGALRLGFGVHLIYLIGPLIRRYRDRCPGIALHRDGADRNGARVGR